MPILSNPKLLFTAITSLLLSAPLMAAPSHNKVIDCDRNPTALNKILTQKASNKALILTIKGTCEGPITINRIGSTLIQSAEGEQAVISLNQQSDADSAISVFSSQVSLKNLHFKLPEGKKMLSVQHNAVVNIENLSSDYHQGHSQTKPFIYVLGNSSLIVTAQLAADLRISGSSFAQFNQGNQNIAMIVSDTSAALAKSGSEFESINLWGNAHLEANGEVTIHSLLLFGQSSAEVLSTQVDALTLGGRTMFAAYNHSTINGPFTFYTDNYIFEISESTLNNWSSQAHSNALTIGFNALVNGQDYPGWIWSGQDGRASTNNTADN